MAKKKKPKLKPSLAPPRSTRLSAVGFVDLGYGAAIRVGDIRIYYPAILQWRDPVGEYDIPGQGKASRTVIIDVHGLKLPCVHGWQLLQKLIHDALRENQ